MDRGKPYVKSAILGTFWVYASRYSGKFVNLISLAILARLLLKEDFGVAGYATVILSFLDFPGLGIGSALVYHPKDARRTNTAFWLAVGIGIVLTVLMLLAAPLVGLYFRDPRAVAVTRWLSVYFLLVAMGVVPSSLLSKSLSFRQKFIPDLAGAVGKGLISITLAWMGFGAFSLITGNLAHTLVTSIILWLVWQSDWKPQLRFDREFARPLLSYAAGIVSVYALGILLVNVDYLIVGRYLGAAALGVYLLAFRIPELLIMQFYAALSEVLFPVFSHIREDTGGIGRAYLTTLRYTSLLTVPMAVGLALVAGPAVLTLFGDKWSEAIPITSAIAVYTLVRSLYFSSGDVYKAQGRPEIITRLHLLNLALLVPALLWAAVRLQSLEAIAWTQVGVVILVGSVRIFVASRLLDVRLIEFGQVLAPVLAASALMGLAVIGILYVTSSAQPVVQLVIAVLAGGVVYLAAIWWFQRDVIRDAGKTLRTMLSRA